MCRNLDQNWSPFIYLIYNAFLRIFIYVGEYVDFA